MKMPELKNVEQVSDGWLKKYVLTYDLPDGRELPYEVVSRKALQRYEGEVRDVSAAEPCASWGIRPTMRSCSFANSAIP